MWFAFVWSTFVWFEFLWFVFVRFIFVRFAFVCSVLVCQLVYALYSSKMNNLNIKAPNKENIPKYSEYPEYSVDTSDNCLKIIASIEASKHRNPENQIRFTPLAKFHHTRT